MKIHQKNSDLRYKGTGLLLFIILIYGCEGTPGAHRGISPLTLAYVQNADPCADVKRNIDAGDFRFVGLVEFGNSFPGLENRPDLLEKFGVRYIHGAGDDIPLAEEEAANEYAQIYNLVLGRELRLQNRVSSTQATAKGISLSTP